jgi:hypothetical protein
MASVSKAVTPDTHQTATRTRFALNAMSLVTPVLTMVQLETNQDALLALSPTTIDTCLHNSV